MRSILLVSRTSGKRAGGVERRKHGGSGDTLQGRGGAQNAQKPAPAGSGIRLIAVITLAVSRRHRAFSSLTFVYPPIPASADALIASSLMVITAGRVLLFDRYVELWLGPLVIRSRLFPCAIDPGCSEKHTRSAAILTTNE
jgi:hypothetical protein